MSMEYTEKSKLAKSLLLAIDAPEQTIALAAMRAWAMEVYMPDDCSAIELAEAALDGFDLIDM